MSKTDFRSALHQHLIGVASLDVTFYHLENSMQFIKLLIHIVYVVVQNKWTICGMKRV
jgi:hypothetical protein